MSDTTNRDSGLCVNLINAAEMRSFLSLAQDLESRGGVEESQ